jgi:hypothetical protein
MISIYEFGKHVLMRHTQVIGACSAVCVKELASPCNEVALATSDAVAICIIASVWWLKQVEKRVSIASLHCWGSESGGREGEGGGENAELHVG